MSDPEELDRRCARQGIETGYHDLWGTRHEASERTKRALLEAMGPEAAEGALPPALPPVLVARAGIDVEVPVRMEGTLAWRVDLENGDVREGQADAAPLRLRIDLPGYHRLAVNGTATPLIVCPPRCHEPPALAHGGRAWGPAVQLYAVRSARNWGMGDFTDLAQLVQAMAQAGAGIVGLNPLHALFTLRPEDASPYSPSSRSTLNVLYIDVEAVEDFAECDAARTRVQSAPFRERLAALRGTELVDYAGVAAPKHEILELLFAHFRERHLAAGTARAAAFQKLGEPLRRQALFDALAEHFARADPNAWGWPAWPEAYRWPDSPEVQRFAREHEARVQYFLYLQWQAERQLAAAAQCARKSGMAVGLYADTAVGASKGGAETWAGRGAYAAGVSVGAPPDEFNMTGQNWGLAPFAPAALRAAAYEPYIAILRAGMRHAGALRIDHVMALARLFWIPDGAEGRDGTYVRYPMEEMFGILALESRRNRCLVIGEDLGTVPPEVREAMGRYGVYQYRPLYFERAEDGGFKAPEHYPREALVAVSTHDLPTLAGYWRGADLAARTSLGLFPSDAARTGAYESRSRDRLLLVEALQRAGLGHGFDPAAADVDERFIEAVHVFLARAPSKILMVQLEDLLGQELQANLPGTTEDRHPNWRRKLPVPLEQWSAHPRIAEIARLLSEERARR